MAKDSTVKPGSWILAEELLENGDPKFLDELRTIHDADRLGAFAATWINDQRPASRRLLLSYLDGQLNTFRHEPLIKRLFKAAEAAGDDGVMARFLVALDRSVRRSRKVRHQHDWATRESWTEETVRVANGSKMPDGKTHWNGKDAAGKWIHVDPRRVKSQSFRLPHLRLFSVATRRYLRRRVWRYFRVIAKQDTSRYVAAISPALIRYTDSDCADGLALIDNWSLMHALFHSTDVLVAKPHGWHLVEGRSLKDLKAAPAFLNAWQAKPDPLLDIVDQAQARPVRQWAIAMLRGHHAGALNAVPTPKLIRWISSDDVQLADLGIDLLSSAAGASPLSTETWLSLLDAANSSVLDRVCALIDKHLNASGLSLPEKVSVACAKHPAVANLGFGWLKHVKPTTADDCRTLLKLKDAQSETRRRDFIDWLCGVLGESPALDRPNGVNPQANNSPSESSAFAADVIVELLDSRHTDVREVAWDWLARDERLSRNTAVWRRLVETPYDDIQLRIASLLEMEALRPDQTPLVRSRHLDDSHLRHLWASVLLNIHRGSRRKTGVVAAIVQRLDDHPHEADLLLPLLSIAARSTRSTEWKSALSGLVRLIEARPELKPRVTESVPELAILS